MKQIHIYKSISKSQYNELAHVIPNQFFYFYDDNEGYVQIKFEKLLKHILENDECIWYGVHNGKTQLFNHRIIEVHARGNNSGYTIGWEVINAKTGDEGLMKENYDMHRLYSFRIEGSDRIIDLVDFNIELMDN